MKPKLILCLAFGVFIAFSNLFASEPSTTSQPQKLLHNWEYITFPWTLPDGKSCPTFLCGYGGHNSLGFRLDITHAVGTNYSAPDVRYYCPGIIIGNAGTNKVMAGVWTMGDQFNFEVKIMAVPASFQASRPLLEFQPDPELGAFLKPPGDAKFSKVELRDPDGKVLAPLQKQDGSLPPRIQVGTFPRYPGQERYAGNMSFRDGLRRSPSELGDFTIQNVYRIEKEGDYTLTVCCAIYILPYNGHPPANVDYDKYQTLSATRVDLPCVTTKIHLAPP